jgi:metallophosphoesterase superfamily enzyme
MILITGNHDILPIHHFIENNILALHQWKVNGITLVHDTLDTDKACISGHLHPGYLISDQKLTHIKLPCFFIKENKLTLPAYGSTTGNMAINHLKPDFVWICTGSRIVKV